MSAHSVECAGLNGCPDVEAHRVDSRLDPGVRAARRVEWDDPKQWDDRQWDNALLRSGWMERLAPHDPTPQYSRLDVLDGLPRPVRADSLRAAGPVIQQEPHVGFGIRLLAVTILLVGCTVLGLAAVGFAHIVGWLA